VSQGVRGSQTIARAAGRKVYLFLRESQGFIECELFDQPYQDSNGKVPPELHVICPHCGGESIIPPSSDPTAKTVSLEYLDPPRVLEMPDNGEKVWQTVRVTVEEVCRCNHPDPAGKGKCRWAFKITDNVVSRA